MPSLFKTLIRGGKKGEESAARYRKRQAELKRRATDKKRRAATKTSAMSRRSAPAPKPKPASSRANIRARSATASTAVREKLADMNRGVDARADAGEAARQSRVGIKTGRRVDRAGPPSTSSRAAGGRKRKTGPTAAQKGKFRTRGQPTKNYYTDDEMEKYAKRRRGGHPLFNRGRR
jgi:hypothetical protein